MTPTARHYLDDIAQRLTDPALGQQLAPAVDAIVSAYRDGGLTYIFGTGHSHLLALDLHYRAGGPAYVVPVLDETLMLHKSARASGAREREPGIAEQVLANYPIGKKDVVIVISNSGVNAVPVEAARHAANTGAKVIAVTSRAYSQASAKGRPILADIADIVIDNGLPPGDALVDLPGTQLKAGAGSTAIGSALLQAIFAEAAAQLAAEGPPPIYRSANMPGAAENNEGLIEHYKSLNPHL
ncbi:MAG: SIS domain-containing protein [Pseudomonadota bacterium]